MEAYLQTEDLAVGYQGRTLIGEISLAVQRGRIVTLIGPNGSGKSTILKTIAGQLPRIGGAAYLDGEELRARSRNAIARRMAILMTARMDPALLRLLRQAAKTTGLIILTDSDGAGFLIRNTLKSALPAEGVLHAYIPDIPGKERRKTAPGKEGLLGVEGMRPEILLQALRNAGADFEDAQAAPAREPVTKQDFFTLGLSGRPDSAAKRAALLQALSLPAHMSANALLQAVNVLFSREEFLARFVEP